MSRSSVGVLFVGGKGPAAKVVGPSLEGAGMIVAADSGYDLARSMGVEPDLLVGDMDSISELPARSDYPASRIVAYDRDKDETDTEIGLRILREHGVSDVTIIGGGGGRLDHLLGIAALFDRVVGPRRWITEHDEVVLVDGEAVFERMREVVCSFFPVGEEEATMRSRGLKWPLDGLRWRRGDAGISNLGVDDEVAVTMLSGRLIMVRGLAENSNV